MPPGAGRLLDLNMEKCLVHGKLLKVSVLRSRCLSHFLKMTLWAVAVVLNVVKGAVQGDSFVLVVLSRCRLMYIMLKVPRCCGHI